MHPTQKQLIIAMVLVGLPPTTLIFLWLINPSYESALFRPGLGRVLLAVCAFFEIVESLTLYAGFGLLNYFFPPNGSQPLARTVSITIYSVFAFLIFTAPCFIVVVFGPALILMTETFMIIDIVS